MQDLIALPGIGPVTARTLIASGIADVAALADVDPAAPPTEAAAALPRADWPAWVAAAREALLPEFLKRQDMQDTRPSEKGPDAGTESAPAPIPPVAPDPEASVMRLVLDALDLDGVRHCRGDVIELPASQAALLDAQGVTASEEIDPVATEAV